MIWLIAIMIVLAIVFGVLAFVFGEFTSLVDIKTQIEQGTELMRNLDIR